MFEKNKTIPGTHTENQKIRQCPKKPFKGLWKAWKITALDYFKNEEKKVTPWKQNIKKRRLLDSTVGVGESVLTPALVIQLDWGDQHCYFSLDISEVNIWSLSKLPA